MISRQRTEWRRLRRRLCSLFALLCVCASILPIPQAPREPTEKESTQPFPCQSRPCGCRSADQCWKKCCCFTNAQKLAWAKANRVIAPQYVHVAAARESKTVECRKSCCSPKLASTTGCQTLAGNQKSRASGEAVEERAVRRATDYVIGIFAEQCRGQSTFWNSLPWAVIPDFITLNPCDTVAAVAEVQRCVLPALSYPPPAPPPRFITSLIVM